jgi:hypothetical protein
MTDDTPKPEQAEDTHAHGGAKWAGSPAEDVDAHGMRNPGGDPADAPEDVDAHGGPSPSEGDDA